MENKFITGFVSEMPVHDGDGYSWGGDVIVTIDGRSINLGSSQNNLLRLEIISLARLFASAPDFAAVARDAADMLESYANYITTVHSDELEIHPYLPELERVAKDMRAAMAKAGY